MFLGNRRRKQPPFTCRERERERGEKGFKEARWKTHRNKWEAAFLSQVGCFSVYFLNVLAI